MTQPAPTSGTGPRDRMVFAIILIVVGIGGLVLNLMEPSTNIGGVIVLVIGLGLLGAFAWTRQYGYLIPGAIMAGLGAGIIASEAMTFTDEQTGGVIVLGLGIGFLAIWVVGMVARVREHHWWPLIPGGILAVIGGALLVGGEAVNLLDYWGVVIIALGVIVLWRAMTEMRPNR